MLRLGTFGQGARKPFRNAEDVRSVSTLSTRIDRCGTRQEHIAQ